MVWWGIPDGTQPQFGVPTDLELALSNLVGSYAKFCCTQQVAVFVLLAIASHLLGCPYLALLLEACHPFFTPV